MAGGRHFGDALTPDDRLRRRTPRLVVASALMAAAVLGGAVVLEAPLADPTLRWAALLALVAGGGAVFSASALAFGAASMADLKASVRRS